MTSYDRGGFVDGMDLRIFPCANGTFTIDRRPIYCADGQLDAERDTIAFSSAGDMLRFLQSEYGFERAEDGKTVDPSVMEDKDHPLHEPWMDRRKPSEQDAQGADVMLRHGATISHAAECLGVERNALATMVSELLSKPEATK